MSGALLAAELLKGGMSTGSALGIGAAAGVADFGLQQAGAALDFKRQKKLLDFQNQFSLDMWNRNNEYNDPTNQMARLIQAGISPGAAVQAISGQGAALSPNVSSTSAPGVNPSSSPHTMSNALGVAADVYNKVTSGQKNESEIKVNDAQIDKWAHENDYTDQQTNQLKIITSYLDEQQQLDIQTKKEILRQIDAQVDLLKSQRIASEKSVEKMDSEIALNSSETDFNRQRRLTEVEMTQLKQWYNNYCNQYKFSPDMDFLQSVATLVCEGKSPSDAYDSLIAAARDYSFARDTGGQTSVSFKPFRGSSFSISVPARWTEKALSLLKRYSGEDITFNDDRVVHDCRTFLRAQYAGITESLDDGSLDNDTWANLKRLSQKYAYLIDHVSPEQAKKILELGYIPDDILNSIDYTKIGAEIVRPN